MGLGEGPWGVGTGLDYPDGPSVHSQCPHESRAEGYDCQGGDRTCDDGTRGWGAVSGAKERGRLQKLGKPRGPRLPQKLGGGNPGTP